MARVCYELVGSPPVLQKLSLSNLNTDGTLLRNA